MGKLMGIFACLLIVGLDVVGGILGIRAEAAQNQEKHMRLWIFECKEPSHDAYVLGFAAATLLVIAHILANLLGGCSVCTHEEFEKASPSKQLSIACLVFTWIILAVGMSMLVIGIISNHKSRASCGFTHHHFLSIGGILCMVTVIPPITPNFAADDGAGGSDETLGGGGADAAGGGEFFGDNEGATVLGGECFGGGDGTSGVGEGGSAAAAGVEGRGGAEGGGEATSVVGEGGGGAEAAARMVIETFIPDRQWPPVLHMKYLLPAEVRGTTAEPPVRGG